MTDIRQKQQLSDHSRVLREGAETRFLTPKIITPIYYLSVLNPSELFRLAKPSIQKQMISEFGNLWAVRQNNKEKTALYQIEDFFVEVVMVTTRNRMKEIKLVEIEEVLPCYQLTK